MAKYRKKPVVIEAVQFLPGTPLPAGCEYLYGKVVINTLEGVMTVDPLDFVITGVKGERYACKPDVFEMTYEKVPDEA